MISVTSRTFFYLITILPKYNFLLTFYIKNACAFITARVKKEKKIRKSLGRGLRDQQIKAYKFQWPQHPFIFHFPSLFAYIHFALIMFLFS